MRILTLALLAATSTLLACGPGGPDADGAATDGDPDDTALSGGAGGSLCGNGVLDDGEACDDGDANSDTAPDACRTTCTLPTCGDAVVDTGEACDDGTDLGGDGCTPTCQAETGPLEAEPNDVPFTATPVTSGVATHGGLAERDTDCFVLDIDDNAFLDARTSDPDGACTSALQLFAYDPDGDLIAEATPDPTTGCTVLDAASDDDLRYLDAGPHVVCAEGLFRSRVPAYRITLTAGDDSCLEDFGGDGPSADDDLDLDGLADPCDADDDDDGVLDEVDNCPRVPNGPNALAFTPDPDGFLRQWLLLGPFEDEDNATGCLPSDVDLTGTTPDGDVIPALGDDSAGLPWIAAFEHDTTLTFLDYFSVSPDREVYAATWVHSATARDAVLAVGADDGLRAWVNGTMVGEESSCQGVVTDDFAYDVTLDAGWNALMFKVRDHGGGWGLRVRLKDADDDPITDLEVSPGGPFPWVDDQTDADGDGIGDVCDPTP